MYFFNFYYLYFYLLDCVFWFINLFNLREIRLFMEWLIMVNNIILWNIFFEFGEKRYVFFYIFEDERVLKKK